MTNVTDPYTLNQTPFKNRIMKASMSEALADSKGRVTPALLRLYDTWGQGGSGSGLTGNVMIDGRHKNEPGVVVLEDESDLPALTQWADIGKKHDMPLIMQLSHPGKQCPKGLNQETVAPSAVPFRKDMQALFATPRELTDSEIKDIIHRFGESARIAKKAGFAGVQVHGAHGYLVSQFLSPLHNQRTDQWGGSLENRMRFPLEVYREIRKQTGDDFIVGIKLNSADFQRGGFEENDSIAVIKALDEAGIDFIEVSGGTYETPAMTGLKSRKTPPQKESTRQREAYFLEFAEKVREHVKTPLMVTGGFRSRDGMDDALESKACDIVGIGRPLAVEPDASQRVVDGGDVQYAIKPIKTGIKPFDDMGIMEIIWYAAQFRRMGAGQNPDPHLSPVKVFTHYALGNVRAALRGRKVLTRHRAKTA